MVAVTETVAGDPRATDSADVVQALRSALRGAVDDSTRRRAEYSTDASNYRVVPQVVAFPQDTDDVLAALEVTRDARRPADRARRRHLGAPGNAVGHRAWCSTSRGTSTGSSTSTRTARTARIEPGVVMASLQKAAAPHGLRFGPDPSTQARATLGGMIGNNACGPRAVAYGRTADNVLALDVVDGTGRRFEARSGAGALDVVPGLDALVRGQPRHPAHRAGPLRPAGLRLLPRAPAAREGHRPGQGAGRHGGDRRDAARRDRAAGPDRRRRPCSSSSATRTCRRAADAVPALLAHAPLAIEGMDSRLVDVVRRVRGAAGRAAAARRAAAGSWSRSAATTSTRPWTGRTRSPRDAGTDRGRPLPARSGGRRDVADPRGRRRPRRPDAVGRAGVARVRGLGRAARAAGRVPARARGAHGVARRRRPARTGTSATGACTCASTSRWSARATRCARS